MAAIRRTTAALHDAEFRAWLRDEYVPIAGGWQY